MPYTVNDVATAAKVSVRTLHHYDAVGLLPPSSRSEAGYRLYDDVDLERLQQILFFKELGFSLGEIRRIMLDPAFDRRAALHAQRALLAEKADRTHAMLEAIDIALDAMEKGVTMDKDDMFQVFGDFDPADYEDEVKERWGDTDAYKESARRTKSYTKADWQRYKDEAEANGLAIAALMDAGVPPTDPRAMDAVEEHRLLIDKWFYPCSHEMHRGLGEMYVADPRFTKNYEKIHPGMAQYVSDAIRANAERAKA